MFKKTTEENTKSKVTTRGFYDEGSLTGSMRLVVALIICLLVAGAMFGLWYIVKPMIGNASKDISEYGVILDESKYTDNDGQYLTGNQVMSYLRSWSNDDVCIKVVTKTNTAGTFYNYKNYDETTGLTDTDKLSSTENNKLISSAGNKTSTNYINPNGQFFCKIVRNQNDVIIAAVLTQQ